MALTCTFLYQIGPFGDDSDDEYTVFAAWCFPKVVRVVNAEHRCISVHSHMTIQARFNFTLDHGCCKDRTAVVDQFVANLSSLTTSAGQGSGPFITWSFYGDLDASKLQKLRQNKFSTHSLETTLFDCGWALQNGNKARVGGNHNLAEGYYNLVNCLQRTDESSPPKPIVFALDVINLASLIGHAVNYGKAGKYHLSCMSAVKVIAVDKARKYGPEQLGYLYFEIGNVLLETGTYDGAEKLLRALKMFHQADEQIQAVKPEDIEVKKKIEEVIERLKKMNVKDPKRMSLDAVVERYYKPRSHM